LISSVPDGLLQTAGLWIWRRHKARHSRGMREFRGNKLSLRGVSALHR